MFSEYTVMFAYHPAVFGRDQSNRSVKLRRCTLDNTIRRALHLCEDSQQLPVSSAVDMHVYNLPRAGCRNSGSLPF